MREKIFTTKTLDEINEEYTGLSALGTVVKGRLEVLSSDSGFVFRVEDLHDYGLELLMPDSNPVLIDLIENGLKENPSQRPTSRTIVEVLFDHIENRKKLLSGEEMF